MEKARLEKDYIEKAIEDQLRDSICEGVFCVLDNMAQSDREGFINAVIPKYNPGTLKEKLKMEYVFSTKAQSGKIDLKKKKVAIIAHLYYKQFFYKCVSYLRGIASEIDIFITTSTEENKKFLNDLLHEFNMDRVQVQLVKNRGREISALLIECKDIWKRYEYLCFVHDKATSGNIGAAKIGQEFMDILWDNLLINNCYVNNVLNFMEKHTYVGLLVPPAPYHNAYFGNYGNEWTSCFDKTKELAEKLKLSCMMSKDIAPITIGTAFWCRTEALKALWCYDWKYEDFQEEPLPLDSTINHAIERILAFVAQHEGYTTGIIENDKFAAVQVGNYQYILNGLISKKRKSSGFLTFFDLINKDFFYDYSNLQYCVQKYKKVLIYGTGFFAVEITKYLERNNCTYDAYVVSDGYRKQGQLYGKRVYELSEIKNEENMLLILALKKGDFNEVYPILTNKGFRNFYFNGEELIKE